MKYEYTHRYIASLHLVAGKDVLDIGSGAGYGSRILSEVAASVIGIDRDGGTVERAEHEYADIGNLRFLQGSWSALPVEGQSVDVVVSFDSSGHYMQHDEMLAEIKRIIRPNGLLIFSMLNRSIMQNSSKQNSGMVDNQYYEQIVQMLQRHFNNVAVFAQRSNVASFIYPIESSPDTMEFQFDSIKNHVPKTAPGEAVYYFIQASDAPLTSSGGMMSVHSDLTSSPDGYGLYTLMEHFAQLYAELDASRRALAAMQESKFWKLRDAWIGVRDRRSWMSIVLPPFQKTLWSLAYKRGTSSHPIPAMKSMMATVVPPLQKTLWGLAYDNLTMNFPTSAMTFLNLGYLEGPNEPRPTLEVIDEPNRLWIQLYHHVATLIDLSGQNVLEVGCGRGGGAAYIKKYLGPSTMVGMDLAEKAVEFCRQTHRTDGLRFMQGDAERIPSDDRQFDVVINVESSHCYPSLDAFFREVKRVLRPGGHFLYADVMRADALPERRRMLKQSGLEIVQEHNITPNVLAALDSTTDQRVALEETLVTAFGADGAREWAILPGSETLDGMRIGTLCYVSMALRAE
ncbi:MAG: class I SAM-dependent methyltransferase [Chloroflexota bacterium]